MVVLFLTVALLPLAQLAHSQEPIPDQTAGGPWPEGQQAVEPEWYQILPPDQPGFPQALSGANLSWGSSPTLADLDGDGTLEVIFAGRDLSGSSPGSGGMVYAYRHNGALFWEKHVRAPVNSTPTAADLDGDGHPDVVVGMGGFPEGAQPWNGGVIALNGLTGQELWTFNTQDWLNHAPDGWLDGVFSTPAIGDINDDGQPEITFGAWDQCIYLLNRQGQPLWGNLPGLLPDQIRCGGHGFYNEDTIWSSPALADVTGDGRLEIIIGADISPGNVHGDPAGGYLYILDADGNALAREWMEQTIFSSPAAADLDKDGAYELVVGTGTYLAGKGYFVSAFDYDPARPDPTQRLVLKWRAATVGRVFASPAVADLNQDGWLDVVITSLKGDLGNDGTFVYAWRGTDGALLFQRRACDMWGNSGYTISSPTIADVDGDNWPEILFSHQSEVSILNHDGTYYSDYSSPEYAGGPNNPGCARDHVPTTRLSYWVNYTLYASPAIGDLDGDGDAEIVIPGHNPNNPNQGMIFAWTGQNAQASAPWPTWHHDRFHTGNYLFETMPPTNPTQLSSPTHTPQVWSTANQVDVVWSGAQDEGSGLAGYSIAWDKAAGTLPDTVPELGAEAAGTTSPALADGQGYYFHLRTGDQAGNWTATALHLGPLWIDGTPPTSLASSPAVVTGDFQVAWAGHDATSGVDRYTVEVRDGDGPWTTWLANQAGTSATFSGQTGHVYAFRSIARDRAGNVESDYTAEGDTQTAVAKYLLQGTILDQRAEPVAGALVTTQPPALNQASTGMAGGFTLGLASGGTFALYAEQGAYGTLPPMKNVTVDGSLAGLDLYLPPATDLIRNGGFETAGQWQMGGVVPPTPVAEAAHTGNYGLQMGDLPGEPPPLPWTWAISQTVTVPEDASEVTLDWMYRADGNAVPEDELLVTVQGSGSTVSKTSSLGLDGWLHDWLDVTELAGQQVVVTLRLTRPEARQALTIYLDEIGLGVGGAHRVFLPLLTRSQ
ncbi:MAG: FG-GAP-like repeat-containing protein [Anaerolineae bacterium]